MKSVCKNAKRVLDLVTAGLNAPGDSKKFDNAPGAFMALHVECIGEARLGEFSGLRIYALAHYHTQNGDLCCDPDVTILRGALGEWYPLTFEQVGIAYRRAVEIAADGTYRENAREQSELVQFVNMWCKNVEGQQGLGLP